MSLFASAGFDLYNAESTTFTAETLSTPVSPVDTTSAFTRSRSSTDASRHSSRHSHPTAGLSTINDDGNTPAAPAKSHSPSSSEVHVLDTDLICVGLSDEHVEQWMLKVLKLIAFPDLVPSCSISRTPEAADAGKMTESIILSNDPAMSSSRAHSPESSSWSFNDDSSIAEDDEGDSSSASEFEVDQANESTSSLATSTVESREDSKDGRARSDSLSSSMSADLDLHGRQSKDDSPRSKPIPFFTFTRTPEGSSLTTDAAVLATLFSESERHMVICGDELEAVDRRLMTGGVESDDDDESDAEDSGTLKCLEIDLRRFGLGMSFPYS